MTDPTAPSPIPQEEPQPVQLPEIDPGPTPLEAPVSDPPSAPGDWRPHD